MIHIVLFEPEIPPNTGNIIRLCANMGASLHLIEPIAFDLSDKKMRRAGLDYHEFANINTYSSFDVFVAKFPDLSVYALSTKGTTSYSAVDYPDEIALLFGPETRGLPYSVLQRFNSENLLTIPMKPNSRSLNLSNSVAIVAYHVWFSKGFD